MAQTYVTQDGDTLWDIAVRYYGDGSRWPEIYHANQGTIGSDPNVIYSGQTLTIPDQGGGSNPGGGGQLYTTTDSDTLWDIASRFYGDGNRWPEIYQANKDQIKDPHWIYPGQVFTIPAA